MSPFATGILLLLGFAGFYWSLYRRWQLLRVGGSASEPASAEFGRGLIRVLRRVLLHDKLYRYRVAGIAHHLVFCGFLVLLIRTLLLWGRGFDHRLEFWLLAPGSTAGLVYQWLKDLCVLAVVVGISIFLFFRLIRQQRRMTLNIEGLLILGAIALIMLSDLLYDTAGIALRKGLERGCSGDFCAAARSLAVPFSSVDAARLSNATPAAWLSGLFENTATASLVVLGHVGFWTHLGLGLALLNALPYSKHFHILTAIPNVFLASPLNRGTPCLLAPNSDSLLTLVERAAELGDELRAPIGVARITHFSWKDLLDTYCCTECGRCSEHCPAAKSGKPLDPKQFILSLREQLYEQQPVARLLRNEREAVARQLASLPQVDHEASLLPTGPEARTLSGQSSPTNLVPELVTPAALWACTTCRACEQECPVEITHVTKILQMRRNLVLVRGEYFPPELQRVFVGIATNGNPWNRPRAARAAWAADLGLKTMAEHPSTSVLLWVGCSASYDPHSQSIARATAQLLKLAGVDFAILGTEESCTGDPARRAGNEHLFLEAAEGNIATFERYRKRGGIRRIVTACPHCYNALSNEYRTLGATYEVAHHSQLLLELLEKGRLAPRRSTSSSSVYQDACYLGRFNDVYDAPRRLLAACGELPQEVPSGSRSRGGCCGAGGARMWMDEPEQHRVSLARTDALLGTGAQRIATGCPFCKTMISDGLKTRERDPIKVVDVAELLWDACR